MQPVAASRALILLDIILALLAAASGIMDALSFLRLDHVFTSAMTGNTALLGLALGQHRFVAALHSSVAFGGFVIGLTVGALLLGRDRGRRRWSGGVSLALMAELPLLAGFAALWLTTADPRSGGILYVMILLAAAAMGMQSAAVNRLHVPGIWTTFFTGTLTTIVTSAVRLVEAPAAAPQPPASTLRQAMTLAAYIIGAAIAGVADAHGIELIAVLPLAALVVVVGLHIGLQ
ncbi:MAG TPA: YoaK family protein [Acetobacteraceae bacterium]|nr:YoaK family protein [Acetobacteraceae bacterium]